MNMLLYPDTSEYQLDLINCTNSDSVFVKQFSDYDVAYKPLIQAEILDSAILQNIPMCFHNDL